MNRIAPTAVRYIKLGAGGAWLDRCISEGMIEFSHRLALHELALADDWTGVEAAYRDEGRIPSKAKDFCRETRDFYTLGADCLWITIGESRLWWAFTEPNVVARTPSLDNAAWVRRVIGSWSDRTLDGELLAISALSTRLTKIAGYRQTICRVDAESYLLRRINGDVDPAAVRAFEARSELISAATSLIEMLHWRDFEVMVDLVFAASGWRRLSAIGGSDQADTDLVLEQTATGERAFVQIKSSANAKVMNEYVARYRASGRYQRMFFVCHSPLAAIPEPVDQDIHLWLGERLAQQALAAGLLDWLLERTR